MRRRSGATERAAALSCVPSGTSVVQTALLVLVAGAISVALSVMAWVQGVRDAKATRRRQLLLALGIDDEVPRLIVGFFHPFWCGCCVALTAHAQQCRWRGGARAL